MIIDDTGKKRWVVGRGTLHHVLTLVRGKQTVFIRRSGGGVTVTQRRRADRKTPQQNAFVYFESVLRFTACLLLRKSRLTSATSSPPLLPLREPDWTILYFTRSLEISCYSNDDDK